MTRPLHLLSLEPFISLAFHKAFNLKDYAEFTISQFKTIKIICVSSKVSTQTRQRPPVLMGLQEEYKGQRSVLSASWVNLLFWQPCTHRHTPNTYWQGTTVPPPREHRARDERLKLHPLWKSKVRQLGCRSVISIINSLFGKLVCLECRGHLPVRIGKGKLLSLTLRWSPC